MTASAFCLEGCDLKTLGAKQILLLSRCWRDDRVGMVHRIDGKVDLRLRCDPGGCACLLALQAGASPG